MSLAIAVKSYIHGPWSRSPVREILLARVCKPTSGTCAIPKFLIRIDSFNLEAFVTKTVPPIRIPVSRVKGKRASVSSPPPTGTARLSLRGCARWSDIFTMPSAGEVVFFVTSPNFSDQDTGAHRTNSAGAPSGTGSVQE